MGDRVDKMSAASSKEMLPDRRRVAACWRPQHHRRRRRRRRLRLDALVGQEARRRASSGGCPAWPQFARRLDLPRAAATISTAKLYKDVKGHVEPLFASNRWDRIHSVQASDQRAPKLQEDEIPAHQQDLGNGAPWPRRRIVTSGAQRGSHRSAPPQADDLNLSLQTVLGDTTCRACTSQRACARF